MQSSPGMASVRQMPFPSAPLGKVDFLLLSTLQDMLTVSIWPKRVRKTKALETVQSSPLNFNIFLNDKRETAEFKKRLSSPIGFYATRKTNR